MSSRQRSEKMMKETTLQENAGASVCIITGADGFVGRELAARLTAEGFTVRGLIESAPPAAPLPESVALTVGDVRDPESLEPLFLGIDPRRTVVIHTAALISVYTHDKEAERTNIDGTKNIVAACKKHGVPRLIHFSSVDALQAPRDGEISVEPERFTPDGLPTSYGRSKAEASQYVLDAADDSFSAVLLLPSCVIGPGDYRCGFMCSTMYSAVRLPACPSTAGGYEFADVRDIASAAINAVRGSGDGAYILSAGYGSVASVFETIAALMHRKPSKVVLPLFLLYIFAVPMALVYRTAGRRSPLSVNAVKLLASHPAYSHERAARDLAFLPRPIMDSVRDEALFIKNLSGGDEK